MEELAPKVRRLPLRIAGVIGLFSAVLHLAIILGQEDTPQMAQAVFWLALMVAAGILAWSADSSGTRARKQAIGAAAIFFVLGQVSSAQLFVIVFLVALVFSVLGFAGMGQSRQEKSADS